MNNIDDNNDSTLAVFSPETNGFKMKNVREMVKARTGFGGKKLKEATLAEINRMQPVADAGYTNLRTRGYKVEAISESKTGTVTFKLTPPDAAVASAEAQLAAQRKENEELRAQLNELMKARS